MGVAGLWSLLEQVHEEVYLKECSGKRIAVDLSGWVVQFASIPKVARSEFGSNSSFFANRGLFFRALNLSKLGIILVFVMDGPDAPPRKGKYNREIFFQNCQQYKALLMAMGFLVLEAEGEAEKMCAELNMRNLVDGVLTSDGDAIVYGAQVVYKGIFTDKKEQKATKFKMANIISKLQMNQNDLVAFALISKGDISAGVPSVGGKGFLELLKEFKNNGVQDSLERLKSWQSSAELISLENQTKQLHEKRKSPHCTHCCHEGTKSEHSKTGCQICKLENGCHSSQQAFESKAGDMKHPLCVCTYCCTERNLRSYSHELKIRRLALQQDANFPSEEIINEFLSPSNTLPEFNSVCMKVPDFHAVYGILLDKLHFSKAEAAKHLIRWTIMMTLNGILTGVAVKPVRILKSCTEQFEKCYHVRWSKLDFDDLSEETNEFYEFSVHKSLFVANYPDMSKEFEVEKLPQKGKRKIANDPNQRKLSDMFKVVKRSAKKE